MATKDSKKAPSQSARHFEFTDEKSSKFWEIQVTGDSFSVRYGKVGTTGQTNAKVFADAAAATKHADKLVSEKLGKGYIEKTSVKSRVTARKNTHAITSVALSIKSVKKIGGVVPALGGVVGKAVPPSPVIDARNDLQEAIKVELRKMESEDAIDCWKKHFIGPDQWPYLRPEVRMEVLGIPFIPRNLSQADDATTLASMANDPDSSVRQYVGANPSTPAAILELLAKDEDGSVRTSVGENPATSAATLALLVKDAVTLSSPKNRGDGMVLCDVADIKRAVAENPSASSATLLRLAKDRYIGVRYRAAANPSTPISTLELLAKESDKYVLKGLAENRATPASILELLAKDDEAYVRDAVAGNPSTPVATLEKLAKDKAKNAVVSVYSVELTVNIRSAVAGNPATPVAILKQWAADKDSAVRRELGLNPATPVQTLVSLSKDADATVRAAVAKNRTTPAATLSLLSNDPEWDVISAVVQNTAVPMAARCELFEWLVREVNLENLLKLANDAQIPADIRQKALARQWWQQVKLQAKRLQSSQFKKLFPRDPSDEELPALLHHEVQTLQHNPQASLAGQLLGCTENDDVLSLDGDVVKSACASPLRIPFLLGLCHPDAPPRLLAMCRNTTDKVERMAIAANPSSGPVQIGLREPRLRLAMSRSAGVLIQLDQATALQMTIIEKMKNEFPDSRMTKDTDEYSLLRTVELAAESLDITTIDVNPEEIDRTSTMLAGPFFTSIDFPIPVGSRAKKMTPVVQIDLRDVSELIEQPLGDGLLQLWYDRPKYEGHIRVIPRSKVNAKHVTKFDLVTGEKFDTFPLPWNWQTYLKGGDVKQVTGVISHGLRSQTSRLEMFMDYLSESMSKALLQAINKFERLTEYELQSDGDRVGSFCGTFYPIQYSAADADKKCLLAVYDWGAGGGAQIFYDIASDGVVKFTFWDCLR